MHEAARPGVKKMLLRNQGGNYLIFAALRGQYEKEFLVLVVVLVAGFDSVFDETRFFASSLT